MQRAGRSHTSPLHRHCVLLGGNACINGIWYVLFDQYGINVRIHGVIVYKHHRARYNIIAIGRCKLAAILTYAGLYVHIAYLGRRRILCKPVSHGQMPRGICIAGISGQLAGYGADGALCKTYLVGGFIDYGFILQALMYL